MRKLIFGSLLLLVVYSTWWYHAEAPPPIHPPAVYLLSFQGTIVEFYELCPSKSTYRLAGGGGCETVEAR
jgi:hypothetical protein